MERRGKHLSFVRMARRKSYPASLMSAYVRESGSGSSRQEGVVGVGLESTLKRESVFYAYNHVGWSAFCREDHGCNLCCDRFDLVAVFPACQFDRFNGRWPRQSPRSNWWPDFWSFRANLLWRPGFRLRCDWRVSIS